MAINKTTQYTTEPNSIPVNTSSGDQTLDAALDSRVIHLENKSDLQSLDVGGLVANQVVNVHGGIFIWTGASFEMVVEPSVSGYGAATSDNTAIVQQALNDWGRIYIPPGYFYDRRSLTVGVDDFIVDDSTGIRVTNQSDWWNPRFKKITTVAHRGALELAPENTLASISTAYCLGFDGVEIDVLWTSDEVPVLMHDDTVDRTTDGTGDISTLTLAQVQALDAGSHFNARFSGCKVPTLAAALDYMKGRFDRIHIEIKDPQSDARNQTLVDMVVDRDMQDQVIFISYDNANLYYIRSINKDVGVGFIDATEAELFTLQNQGGRVYCSFNDTALNADADIVKKAIANGISVYGKVTNSYEEAERLRAFGIGVIQSDCGIMVDTPAMHGELIRFNHDLSGASLTEDTGSVTADPSKRLVTIVSSGAGRDSLNLETVLSGTEFVEVDLYARSVSGDPGLCFLEKGVGDENIDLEFDTGGDVIRYREKLHLRGGYDDFAQTDVALGFGAARTGTLEVFDLHVSSAGLYHVPQVGSVSGLIRMNIAGPLVADNWSSFGIAGVAIDGTRSNVIHVLMERTGVRTIHPQLSVTSSDATTLMIPKFMRYNDPGAGANPSSTYASLEIAVFNPDGTGYDVDSTDNILLAVSA